MEAEAHPSPILALPGPQYCYDFEQGIPIADCTLVIHQEGGHGRGTAWAVWDGAVAAAKHLEALAAARPEWAAAALPAPSLLGAEGGMSRPVAGGVGCLELGSGTGLAGLAAAAALRLPVTLTDLPEALPALRANVAANPALAPLATVAACDWTAPDPAALLGHGLVIAADCVWLEELVAPLVATLEAATAVSGGGAPPPPVLLTYQSRSARVDALLFGLLAASFEVEPAEALPGEPDRGKIDVYWLKRRRR